MSIRRAAVAVAAFFVSAIALAVAPPAKAIINGAAAGEGAYPFMAALSDSSGFAYCGGSVIAPNWVLTAAHCVEGTNAGEIYVITGRTDLSNTSTGQVIRASAVYVHPRYENSHHDAALVRLSSATSSPAIQLSNAANDNLEVPGTIVRVTGWGDTLPTLGIFATNQLREVDLKVVSDQQCGQTNVGFDGPTGVCAEELLKDSCNGDSGGPLFATENNTRIQIGIVSYGTSCALPKFPGVYSEVNNPDIRNWITANSGV